MQISQLTKEKVEGLRRKPYGTNGKAISVSDQEIEEMHEHLKTLYSGRVYRSFAEKIAYRYKAYYV